MPQMIRRAHIKSPPRKECTAKCGAEIRNGGTMCTRCREIYVRRKNHSNKWKDATEEELLAEVKRTRDAEKALMRARRDKEVNE
ncbi:MAG: hypothetical protein PHH85_02340 [Candidatus Methanoperedens sp.]|nr:hypothetical protein [Candidatus Methanoperedens sp.]